MPANIFKRVWDYSTYNIPFLLFVFILILASNTITDFFFRELDNTMAVIIQFMFNIVLWGYGMQITRDRINGGKRLPKLLPKVMLSLGVKLVIVSSVYVYVQGIILDFICSPLNFQTYDLEDMLWDLPHTIHEIYTHDPASLIIFFVVGTILFYITAFFLEIAIAKLADTGSILEAFNLKSIFRSIHAWGWKNYTKEYTLILITVTILFYIGIIQFDIPVIDYVFDTFLMFLIFVTQFMGIGAVYAKMKAAEAEKLE